ncbi:hypothetical protein KDI_54830 [Dictyobacter arantiisoli]|uniref:Gfo/Idh/MocA-like oxidoreductase C-terminal domain-containing protein n=2 Tax=Dictyobacter arantiisoli TaxID=2014874 RepID=A0A5A5TLB5_9CHLR|nr:hypothetical protein KDI_54830 [Dictyobacter arantiisoli]
MAIVESARRHQVFLMEAFTYRYHPQIEKVTALIRSGVIGEVHTIQVNFAFQREDDHSERRLIRDILDVGGNCVSLARLVAGVALGLSASGRLGDPSTSF